MDSRTIELKATNAVIESLISVGYINPYISENDKEPSWDGAIYIYRNKNKKKDELIGRVFAQVKGKVSDDHSKSAIKYSVSTSDLRNYHNDGGCIYFVVYISEDGQQTTIYYNYLTPVKLKLILNDLSEKQRKKSIELKTFPNDVNKKMNILLNGKKHSQKQLSFKDAPICSVDDHIKMDGSTTYVIPYSFMRNQDFYDAIIDNEIYLYIKNSNFPILQPVDAVAQSVSIEKKIEDNVSINGNVYFKEYTLRRKKDEFSIILGKDIEFIFKEDLEGKSSSVKFSYNVFQMLRQRTLELNFLIGLIEHKNLSIGSHTIRFDFMEHDIDIDKMREEVEHLKEIVHLLNQLNCYKDLDLSELSKEDWIKLNMLINGILYRKVVTGIKIKETSAGYIEVANLKFMLICIKEEHGHKIYDFFSNSINEYSNINSSYDITSRFYMLNANDFIILDNIDYAQILESIKQHDMGEYNSLMIQEFVFRLLNAADVVSGRKKDEILNLASELYDWSTHNEEDSKESNHIDILNKLQIIKRQRKYSEEEVELLKSIATKSNENCKLGALLLLDEKEKARECFYMLSKEEQEKFSKYPIFKFMGEYK